MKSKFNIFSKIRDSENYFLINLLSGQADILTPEKAEEYKNGSAGNNPDFTDKGYFINEEDEKSMFNNKYLDFLDNREKDEIQIFFVPWYTCNFKCDYCFQDEYAQIQKNISGDVLDAFFNYVRVKFAGRKKYLTLFGGEPLLPGKDKEDFVKNFIRRARLEGISMAVVTNGYHLNRYIPILREGLIREIQVTLDGPRPIHDKRRPLKSGDGTFDEIVKGIDACIEAGFPINLRVVADRSNIDHLPELARFAISKGWTKSNLFKTQIGRNYELHHCQADQSRIFERAELYDKLFGLVKAYPEILEFHKPVYSISKFLWENGKLPEPLFDACPGTKTEWAFDYTGSIYACTATVGKKGEELGTFYPEIKSDEAGIEEWGDRDITTIKECGTCPVKLACGGGCAAIAKNKTGIHNNPDCRSVKDLLEMGINLYFESEKNNV